MACVGNFRILGYLKGDEFCELNDKKESSFYKVDRTGNLSIIPEDHAMELLTIAYCQTASQRFKDGSMKLN